ncbi:hypothetical protein M3Y94_01026200 [Aphelenchoides besseyi]|nr:hypothetical protein M3Y94_01026200 [Aphelenchoides besseyi]KAI6223861.1 hypothetical protein M3Y95_00821300 [Aphelenchoides besseyi]
MLFILLLVVQKFWWLRISYSTGPLPITANALTFSRLKHKAFDEVTQGGIYEIIEPSGSLSSQRRRFTLQVLRYFGLGKNRMQERVCLRELMARMELFLLIINQCNVYKFFHGEEELTLYKMAGRASLSTEAYKCSVQR